MTVDQLIALIASVGACLAAVATFLTVREMAMQRTASYHPELVISRTLFESRPISVGHLPTSWVASNEKDSGRKNENAELRFSVPLNNIGLGAAKNLEVQWDFPIEEITKEIATLAAKTTVPANISFKNGMFSIRSDVLGTATSIWTNERSTKIDYVLPAAEQREGTEVKIPLTYIMATSALLYFSFATKSEQLSIPALTATIRYQDIADSSYRTSFDIQFRLIMLSENSFHAILEAERKLN